MNVVGGFTYFLQDFKFAGGMVGGCVPQFLCQSWVWVMVFVQIPGNLIEVADDLPILGCGAAYRFLMVVKPPFTLQRT